MRFDIVTLFPEMVREGASCGVVGNAIKQGLLQLQTWNPRDYASDKHRTVDDTPYGGGPGMVLKYPLLCASVASAKKAHPSNACKVVYLSPQGKQITQDLLRQNSRLEQLILVAGRYEGVDQRFVDNICDEEWSLGDYIISGGELAVLVVVDAISRLIPDVLGNATSFTQDSYSNGLLEYPHFTRPATGDLGDVPAVLLSGNHQAIATWRLQQSLGRTALRRPDLLAKKQLSSEQEDLLTQFLANNA